MLKKNKVKVLLSSLAILLPAFFGLMMWKKLPNTMATHWGIDSNTDGFGSKAFVVFGLPVMLLAVHLLCLFFTALDWKQKGQNEKALRIVFWIIPAGSLFSNGIIYAAAFGREFDFAFSMPALLGLLFLFIGNYLPKIKQNRTLGIKVSWTLNNEENWNQTHRFGGKVWVIGGLILIFSIFLPPAAITPVTICTILAMTVIPVAYSYHIYKKHQKEGILYAAAPKSKAEKLAVQITAVITVIILIGTGLLMFTGDIDVHCEDTFFQINASYWPDLKVDYSEIDDLEYRKDFDPGVRANGFGSARLAMGTFQNHEFGSYTLYAYTAAKEYLILKADKKILVIGMKDPEETQRLYQSISVSAGAHGASLP